MAKLLYWPIVDADVESLPDPSSTQMANQRNQLYHELGQVTKDVWEYTPASLILLLYVKK